MNNKAAGTILCVSSVVLLIASYIIKMRIVLGQNGVALLSSNDIFTLTGDLSNRLEFATNQTIGLLIASTVLFIIGLILIFMKESKQGE